MRGVARRCRRLRPPAGETLQARHRRADNLGVIKADEPPAETLPSGADRAEPQPADAPRATAAAALAALQSQLAGLQRYDPLLYRVVEVLRDPDGRLRQCGRIWHSDLDTVRRFGRAVAANSVSHKVLIADAAGSVVEELPVAAADPARGWDGWREMPLPAVPRSHARRSLRPRLPQPAAAAPPSARRPPSPAVEPSASTPASTGVGPPAAAEPAPSPTEITITLP